MAADFFPDTIELTRLRNENANRAREAEKVQTGQESRPESEAVAVRREREIMIAEFYRKMQALGEPYDEAWSPNHQTYSREARLSTKAYVLNYRLNDNLGSAVLSAWVSKNRLFSYIFDELIPDVPYFSRSLDYSERNLGLIEEKEWNGIVAAMKNRLQGSVKYN